MITYKFVEGKAAKCVGNAHFNQKASEGYRILSWSAREDLRNESEASMTEVEVNRRVRRIFRCIHKEVCSNIDLFYIICAKTSMDGVLLSSIFFWRIDFIGNNM